jgi:hypothetical protein
MQPSSHGNGSCAVLSNISRKGNQESFTMNSLRKEACSEAPEDREAILNGG